MILRKNSDAFTCRNFPVPTERAEVNIIIRTNKDTSLVINRTSNDLGVRLRCKLSTRHNTGLG